MEKMRMESVDMTAQNIDKIAALFPICITETMGENGKPKRAVNFELLKQMLSDEVIGGMKPTNSLGSARKPPSWRQTNPSARHCAPVRKKV